MKKYRVYAIATASWVLGEYEASSPEEAQSMAENDKFADGHKSLCWQCGREIDLGDVWENQVEEIND